MSDLLSDPIVNCQHILMPYGHYILAYLLPTTIAVWKFGESPIFAFLICVLRYQIAAHRVMERACCDKGARSLQSVFHSAPRAYG